MASEVATLLEILGDGEWHLLTELQHELGLAEHKVQGIVEFLCMFDFTVIDETKRRLKVKREFQALLVQT